MPTPWKIGDHCYGIFLRDQTYFEPRRKGVVVGVGRVGFAVRLDAPNWKGQTVERIAFHVTCQFRTFEEADAHCRANPTLRTRPASRDTGPALVSLDDE